MAVIQIVAVQVYFIPVSTRVPLKFGTETLNSVTCARVAMTVIDDKGRHATGWGETPLSVQWAWPSNAAYQQRCDAMLQFCGTLAQAWTAFPERGHAFDTGFRFLEFELPELLKAYNRSSPPEAEPMPWLAALICASAFDIALHDAYGRLLDLPVYHTYGAECMRVDLSHYLEPAPGSSVSFVGRFPADFFVKEVPTRLMACHLVGGSDLLHDFERSGDEPEDDFPITLPHWVKRDGLKFLKVKLRGDDSAWDYHRLVRVGMIAIDHGVTWLTADFNCTVSEPAYVNDILDRLMRDHPRVYQMILYVEQPFPYDLERNQIDVHSVSARKPLFMDESAHDWRMVRLGRQQGWTGVALKTCKTQTGALLSLCWAKAHGMTLMVQDLTNPMLAQIPHCLLAAHAGTIMGVETNAMQFYPSASDPEAKVHPGLYERYKGQVDLSTISGPGFGYRLDEIDRELPPPTYSEAR